MSRPVVVLVAHGTADPAGRAVLDDLRTAVAHRLPGRDVRLAFVDVIEPTPAQVLVGTERAVLVPLFLASGYHVGVDVPAAAAGADGARASGALGSDPLVVAALGDGVRAVEPRPGAVVLAAAGSTRDAARAEVALAADLLSAELGCPVTVAFLSGPGTTVPEAIAALSTTSAVGVTQPGGVVVAGYLLAPGFFHTKATALAADHGLRCTDPIGVHPRIIDLVVRRATDAHPGDLVGRTDAGPVAGDRRSGPPHS